MRPKAGSNQLREAIDDLTAAHRIWPTAANTLELLTEVLKGTDYDGNTRTGIGDPTPQQAAVVGPWLTLQQELLTHIHEARNHARLVYQLLNRIPSDLDTAALARLHRCTGGAPSLDPWTRPECTNIIGMHSTTGLCDACRQRRDHWQRRQDVTG